MNFDRFKKIWLDFKSRFVNVDQIELKEQKLKWAKARLSVRMLGNFHDFEDWLNSMLFDYFKNSRDTLKPEKAAYFAGRADAIEEIRDQIIDVEKTVKGLQVNLDALKKKKERKNNKT